MASLSVLLWFANLALAALPQVDFNRMGTVGLAGAFAGLDLLSTNAMSFDPSTSTLFSRSSDGSLVRLASTNEGGKILAGCSLQDTFYFAGSFESINGTSANNVASYVASTDSFSSLGSNSPNGQVDALFCDAIDSKVWAGGSFTSPGASIAIWDPKAGSWDKPPFVGVTGAQARVSSITSNSSNESIFFSGSFLTTFGNQSTSLNGTNNPNVPFSSGATPFSSSLVPVPLQNAQVIGSPSSTQSGFGDITSILCPAGNDGPGNTWFAADNNEAVITIRTFSFISASGIRLGNTFQSNRGTTAFSVTTIPDNVVQTLQYIDPATSENKTCSDPCPLTTDSSVLYQDFLFDNPEAITGVQIKLSEWTGASPGLHLLQVLSSGAFASSIDDNNTVSCFAPNPSNTTRTGSWDEKVAVTNIAATTQSVLVSSIDVGTPPSSGPSFTWIPYVSASGTYDINMLVPGCSNFQDCPSRTSVKVTVFPGGGLDPWVTTVSQQNTEDASILIYSGPVLPSSPNFVATINMILADVPTGTGQDGKYELVADRIQLVLKSANVSSTNSSSGSSSESQVAQRSFGFLEWPRTTSSSDMSLDGTKSLPNSTLTALDDIGLQLFSALGGNVTSVSSDANVVTSVVHHPSGAIFLAGEFSLNTTGAANIISFRNGQLSTLSERGLNGPVNSLVLNGNQLFIGGSFTGTQSSSLQSKGIIMYNIGDDTWSSLGGGVNGIVNSLSLSDGKVQVAGNFTSAVSRGNLSFTVAGFATWNIAQSSWTNTGGFISGNVSFVGNGTSQFVAGQVTISRQFGSQGMVLLQNGKSGPQVVPLGVELASDDASTPSNSTTRSRRHYSARSWMSHIKVSHIFKRQSTQELTPLPSLPVSSSPTVFAGAFWTNDTSSNEVAIIGGNFSFAGVDTSTIFEAVGLYDPVSVSIQGLSGPQINGTVYTLLVDGNNLYIGGQFTIQGLNVNSFALYDLLNQRWDTDSIQPLQPSDGSTVVRSLSTPSSRSDTIIVAGSFAQAGTLPCQSICSFDKSTRQWNSLGSGIRGQIASVDYTGSNEEVLVAAGSLALSGNSSANVAQYSFANDTWMAIGASSDIPGPVTAIEVNAGNASSIFAAGQTSEGEGFLIFWDGAKWVQLGSTFQSGTNIAQLTMVPLQDTHTANGIIESDRMLLMSGALVDSNFGNASSILFDGLSFIPYLASSTASGTPGAILSLFHSFSSFSFDQRKLLAVGVVILISIAIAAGVVFLLALIGILWTLFSRKDDKLNKFDSAEDEDDDSTHHRPSSLLEHINAATRTTILGAGPFPNFSTEKGDKPLNAATDQDPFGPDASNYMRAETPSDAAGGMMSEEASRPAHARYSFDGAGEGELPMSAGAEVEVLDDRDPAWWYARDVRTGQEGVVPAAYLY
ncbi:cortical protein marker for cell polarity-domain-containing protein [Cyathus striatus]|nr:cortical protein marker for cell polarity-domain-containing protein [Cyathus striatus]